MTRSDETWSRCQDTIRKLLLNTGKDALVYAKTALENEDTAPEKLKTFWENTRKYFDEFQAKK